MRFPWHREEPQPVPPPMEMCTVGGCGSAATHTTYIDIPMGRVAGDCLFVPLCDPCDLAPVIETPVGIWQALDEVTPEQLEEDRPYLLDPPAYACNVALPSGRSWRWVR